MMLNRDLINEYEVLLKMKSDRISFVYIKNKQHRQKSTIELIKYAVEFILHYTPKEAERVLTYEMLDRLRLTPYIDKGISFLPGLNETIKVKGPDGKIKTVKDKTKEALTIKYILNKCYPTEVRFDKAQYILSIYEAVLAKKQAYPKKFFKEPEGKNCVYVCLNYMLRRYIIDIKAKNIDELYALFANKKEIIKILKKYYLYKAVKEHYDSDALEMLHDYLTPEQKNQFLYEYYKFNAAYKELQDSKASQEKVE